MKVKCEKCQEYKEVINTVGSFYRLDCSHLVIVSRAEILEDKPYTDDEVKEAIDILEIELENEKAAQQIHFNSPVHNEQELAEEFLPLTPLSLPEQISTSEVRELKVLQEEIKEENKEVVIETVNESPLSLVLPTPCEIIKQEEKSPYNKDVEIIIDKGHFRNRKTGDTPFPYQQKGIDFAVANNFRVLIADEQGLGKTIQALGVMHYAMTDDILRELFFPVLITAKSSIKTQWVIQLLNWGGSDFLPQIIDDSKIPPVGGFNVYIASYDIFRRFTKTKDVMETSAWGHEVKSSKKENPFYTFPFKTIIMDEVQAIKGDSQRTQEVKKIARGKNVIALSGTPIKNNAVEYFTILNMLQPAKFLTKQSYLDRWVKVEIIKGVPKYTGIKYPERFAEYTSDMVIRRTREQVKEEIGMRVTKANRIFYHVDFESDKLKKAYKRAEAEFIAEMEEKTKNRNPVEIIGMLSVMRHLVGLNKIVPTVDLATEFAIENPTGKLVIFAHHADVMDAISKLLTSWCIDNGYEAPLTYHSGLNQDERFQMIANFVDGKKDKKGNITHTPFIIGSTLAMGEGVDRLQEVANDCIIAERQWNPANEEQAESRLVRIGQKKDFVNATYPIATDTIDEYFCELVEVKRKSMRETLDGKSTAEWNEASLMVALYDAIVSKGRKKTVKGW